MSKDIPDKIQQDKREPQTEVIPFDDSAIMDDERMRTAALILAKAGYKKGSGRFTGCATLAARQAGVNRSTLYEWLKNEEFCTVIESLKSQFRVSAWQNVERMSKKSLTANIFMLKVLDPELCDDNIRAIIYKSGIDELMAKISEPPPQVVILGPGEESITKEDLEIV